MIFCFLINKPDPIPVHSTSPGPAQIAHTVCIKEHHRVLYPQAIYSAAELVIAGVVDATGLDIAGLLVKAYQPQTPEPILAHVEYLTVRQAFIGTIVPEVPAVETAYAVVGEEPEEPFPVLVHVVHHIAGQPLLSSKVTKQWLLRDAHTCREACEQEKSRVPQEFHYESVKRTSRS
jgi:hypothetical protein